MFIIIEGPDGSGKTTLANQLAKQTGYRIVHRSKPTNEEEKVSMMKMYVDCIQNDDNVILDRCWYSEMVYGVIMRDATYITEAQMQVLEAMVAKKGAIVIHCTDRTANLWKRCKQRGEDYITSQHTLDLLARRYDVVLHTMRHVIPVVRYCIND